MSFRRFAVPAFATVALMLATATFAVAGCGGGSKGTSTTASSAKGATATASAAATVPTTTVQVAVGRPLTRGELIAKGDAICARANTKRAAISVNSRSQFIRVLSQVAIYDSAEARALAKLVPPASLKSSWSTIINHAHVYSEYVKRAAGEGQTAGQIEGPIVRAAELELKKLASTARAIGFKLCSQTS